MYRSTLVKLNPYIYLALLFDFPNTIRTILVGPGLRQIAAASVDTSCSSRATEFQKKIKDKKIKHTDIKLVHGKYVEGDTVKLIRN